jgi:hypothetical protein
MKKSYRKQSEKDADRNRLKALTSKGPFTTHQQKGHELVNGYLIGIYYEIDKNLQIITIEIYEDGKLINRETGKFDYWISFKNESQYI